MSEHETVDTTVGAATGAETPVNASINAVDTAAEYAHEAIANALASTGNEFLTNVLNNSVVFFLLLVLAGFIVSYAFVYICKNVIKIFTSRTETDLDDILLERLQHPVAISLFLIFISIALVPLSLSSVLASITNKILISGNILLIGTIINRIIATLLLHYGSKIASQTESTVDDHVLPIVRKMITAVVYSIAVLFILTVWGIQITPLLAGAGIAGIAFAFAMQESLKNIFGGVSLALDKSYAVGDRIKLADGTVGTVDDISLRSTKIRTFDGDLIVVPNGKIANENFQTYAQPTQETRVVINFGVAYGSDVEKTRKVVLDAIKGIEHQFEDKKRELENTVQFVEMAAYSLNFRASFWVSDYRHSWAAKVEANERIYNALNKAKIEIPFPVQTIHLKK